MFEKDYIMRLMQVFAAALARVLFNKSIQNYEQARVEIDSTLKKLLNTDLTTLRDKPVYKLFERLKKNDGVYWEQCNIAAELLYEDAEISELQSGPTGYSHAQYHKSLRFYVESLTHNMNHGLVDSWDKIATIIEKIGHDEASLKTIHSYFFATKDYGKAEDYLFRFAETGDETVIQAGEYFYQTLLGLNDDELVAGNLPRNEVEQGFAEFKIMNGSKND